jgi:hypothetical protein
VTGVPSWVTITSGASGSGNGTVEYMVAANSGAARSATLTIAGLPFVIDQMAFDRCELVATLSPAVIQSGTLSETDCTKGARGSDYYTDRYAFDVVAGQRLAVQLSSQAFDTYLYVRGPNGAVIMSDDNGGSGNNSRLPPNGGFLRVPEGADGQYVIEVTSRHRRAKGAYSLLVTER